VSISVSGVGADAKSRIVAIRLALLTLRSMENWREAAGGYDEAMILLAVVAITSERLVRSGLEPELENLNVALPEGQLANCSISSIAAATGLNRETARRKVQQLAASGLLESVGRASVRFTAGLLQERSTRELVRTQLEAFARTADQLVRDGAIIVKA
jgi:hypothetical protein